MPLGLYANTMYQLTHIEDKKRKPLLGYKPLFKIRNPQTQKLTWKLSCYKFSSLRIELVHHILQPVRHFNCQNSKISA